MFCFVCLRLVYPMLPVFLDCQLMIAPSVFSNVYSYTCFHIPIVLAYEIIYVIAFPTKILVSRHIALLVVSWVVGNFPTIEHNQWHKEHHGNEKTIIVSTMHFKRKFIYQVHININYSVNNCLISYCKKSILSWLDSNLNENWKLATGK